MTQKRDFLIKLRKMDEKELTKLYMETNLVVSRFRGIVKSYPDATPSKEDLKAHDNAKVDQRIDRAKPNASPQSSDVGRVGQTDMI